MKRAFVAVAVMVTAALSGGLAHAAWLSGDGSGSAQATATAVNGGNKPTALASGSSVTVDWTASTLAGGAAVSGYEVKRYTAVGDVQQTIGTGCSGIITALSCTETGVAVGSWTYSVTPVRANWTGTESTKSDIVTVAPAVVDNTAPTATITFPVNGSTINGTTYNAGCTPHTSNVCGTASDATGVAAVKVSILRSASPSRYWNPVNSTFDISSEALSFFPATGTTAWRLPVSLITDSSYTVRVQTTDTHGNTQASGVYAATSTFTYDNTAATITGTAVKATASSRNNAAKVTVNGDSSNAASPAQVTVVICGTNVFPCASPLQTLTANVEGNGKWSVETTSLSAGTVVYARASHTDTAGNTGNGNVAGPETVLS